MQTWLRRVEVGMPADAQIVPLRGLPLAEKKFLKLAYSNPGSRVWKTQITFEQSNIVIIICCSSRQSNIVIIICCSSRQSNIVIIICCSSRQIPIPKEAFSVLWEHCIRLSNRTFVEG